MVLVGYTLVKGSFLGRGDLKLRPEGRESSDLALIEWYRDSADWSGVLGHRSLAALEVLILKVRSLSDREAE